MKPPGVKKHFISGTTPHIIFRPALFATPIKRSLFKTRLIRGRLKIGRKTVAITNYPNQIPIWALGGTADRIAPPLQAVGHLDMIPDDVRPKPPASFVRCRPHGAIPLPTGS